MKEIEVYMHFDVNSGLTISGADEVNSLINRGGKVVSIEPRIRTKLCDGETVYARVTGWLVKVTVDDSNMLDS